MGLIRKNLPVLNNADKKIAVSNAVQKKMSVCGIGKNAAVIPNPVDLEKFDKKSGEGKLQSASGKKMVLFAGRFSYEKGISNMMEFISKVSSEKNDVEFVLAGSGPLLGFAENFVKKKNSAMFFLQEICRTKN